MITVEHLNVTLQDFVLKNISLRVEENDFFILMGPTGAGKTVLLEAIAGLVPIKTGRVFVGEKEVTSLPPEKRGVSIVYQDYALFPHLTVKANITYGLHFHRVDKHQASERLNRLLEVLNLSHLQARLPTNLSGGEKQRVSLARALMVDPKVLLLDEPLSALDPGFREEVRNALKMLHRASTTTFLMVTHDFAEVLSLGTRAAVMNNGSIEQIGEVRAIFEKPSSPFVADFVGMKNLFSVTFRDTKATLRDLEVELGREPTNSHGHIAIRPEDIVLSKGPLSSSMRNSFHGIVTAVFDQGFYHQVHVQVGEVKFKSLITKRSLFELELQEGTPVFVSFKSTGVHIF
jgi:molybdate/tungstate transport system ATP-binding protein